MNSIEKAWKQFLQECLDNGEWTIKDDGDEILEIIDNHCFIPNVMEALFCQGDNITLPMFLDMIDSGVFNIGGYPIKDTALGSYVKQMDDPEQIYLNDSESFVYTYPERLFNVHQVTRDGEIVNINQVDVIINRLKEHYGSNRGVANLYMSAYDKDEQHIPCLQFVQAIIRDEELSLHVLFRSNDCWGGFPSNMLFLQYLGLKITDELKKEYPTLKFKGIYYNSTSLHIYRGDYEQAKKLMK